MAGDHPHQQYNNTTVAADLHHIAVKSAFFFTSAHAKPNLSAREGEFSFSRSCGFSTFFLLLCTFLCTCARARAKPQATPAQGDLNLSGGENKKGSLDR